MDSFPVLTRYSQARYKTSHHRQFLNDRFGRITDQSIAGLAIKPIRTFASMLVIDASFYRKLRIELLLVDHEALMPPA